MFKKITFTTTILIVSFILLAATDSYAQRGGRGGGGMMGGGGGFTEAAPFDANDFRKNGLLAYLVDSNNVKVDPSTLSETTLQTLYNQISMGTRGGVLDPSIFYSVMNNNSRGGRGGGMMGGMMGGMGMEMNIIDPNDPNSDPMIPVSLNGLEINAIIQMLISWTGKAVLPSNESLGLTITVYSPQMMRRSQAINLLYHAMKQQGFVAEVKDDIIYIIPSSRVQTIDAPLMGPDDELMLVKDKQSTVRKIFRIKNYSPSTMGQLILPYVNSVGVVTAEETTRTLMVMDNVETLLRIEKIIQQFDTKLAETVTEILQVQHRDPQEMVTLLQTIMTSNITSSGTLGGMMGGMMGGMGGMTNVNMQQNRNTQAQQRGGRGAQTQATTGRTATQNTQQTQRGRGNTGGMMGGMSMIGAASASAMSIGSGKPEPILIPDTTNRIIVATAIPEDMLVIKKWLLQLDTDAQVVWNPGDLRSIDQNKIVQKMYYLQYNSPQRMIQVLEPLLSDAGYISGEEDTGRMLIRDTAGTVSQLETIIKELDVPESDPAQQQFFVVEKGDVREIVDIINMILSGEVSSTGSRTNSTTGARTATTGRTTTGRTTTGRTTTMGGR